jgi:transposase
MSMKGDPAVRLCVTCGQLKAADQFAPRRRKCVACQQAQPGRGDRPGRPPLRDPHAAVRARARDQALRRLGLEHLNAYRELYRAERRAIPDSVPTDRARSLAVSRALRMLERQHRHRYKELYQQELKHARSQLHPRRPGRPPGAPDRLTIAPKTESTWRRDGAGHRPPREQGEGARQRAKLQAVREQAAELFAQGVATSSVARRLGVARQTAVSWHARWREGGAAALRSRGPSRHPAIPDSQLPAIEKALLKGPGAYGFDGDVWTAARVAVVIQRVTGVQLRSTTVQRLLRERLGWSVQPIAARGRPQPRGPASRVGQGTGQGQQ